MNLKSAEQWIYESNGAPWSHEDLALLITQAQADALRTVAKRLLEEDTKLDAYYEITRFANQLDPRPES